MAAGRLGALVLSTVVTIAALSLTPASEARPEPDPAPPSDAPAALPAAVALEDDCDPIVAGDPEASPKRLIGQVTSLDHGAGRMTLATRAGAVALDASAKTMNHLSVGDVLVLELASEPDAVVSRTDCP